MKRLNIVVHGRVQRVGYRDAVAEIARRLGIKGAVRNSDDEVSVEIVAEGEDKELQEFLRIINIKDYAAEVEKIDVGEEKATGEFKYFKIIRGEGFSEVGERIDVAGKLLYAMLGKQDKMLEKQDKMLEKQDTTIEGIKGMLEKQDKTTEEIKGMKNEMCARFDGLDTKYGTVSQELKEISKNIHELVEILKAFSGAR